MLPSPEVVRAEGWKAAQGSGRHESTPLVLPSAPSLFLPSIHPPLQTFPEAQRKTSEQKILQRKGLCREKHPTPPRMSFPLPRSPSGWEPEEAEPLLSRTLNFRRETPPSEWHRTGPTGRFKRSRPQVRIRGHGKPFPRKQGIISALLVLCGLIFLGAGVGVHIAESLSNAVPFYVMAGIALFPGTYASHHLYRAWRGDKGWDYDQLPHTD